MKQLAILLLTALLLTSCAPAEYADIPSPSPEVTSPPAQETAAPAPTTARPTKETASSYKTNPYRKDAEEPEELSGSLSLSAFSNNDLVVWAEVFMDKHPDVTITVEDYTFEHDTYAMQSEKYIYDISTALMGGQAADIIQLSGLPVFKLNCEDLFYDLNDFINEDPYLERSDFYENILTACEIDGNLYGLPITMMYNITQINSNYRQYLSDDLFDRLTIDYQTMYEITENVKASLPVKKELFFGYHSYNAYELEQMRFFDPKSNTINFGDGFLEYIASCEPWFSIMYRGDHGNDRYEPTRDQLVFDDAHPFPSRGASMVPYDQREGSWLLTNTLGVAPFTTDNMMAITKTCDNPELAWEFIKFITSSEALIREDVSHKSMPVRKEAYYDVCRDTVMFMLSANPLVEGREAELLPELLERIDATNQIPSYYEDSTGIHYTYKLINTEIRKYAEGEKSLEQVAQYLTDRLTVYVNE